MPAAGVDEIGWYAAEGGFACADRGDAEVGQVCRECLRVRRVVPPHEAGEDQFVAGQVPRGIEQIRRIHALNRPVEILVRAAEQRESEVGQVQHLAQSHFTALFGGTYKKHTLNAVPVRIGRQYPDDAGAALLESMGVSALSRINDLPAGAAEEELLSCCASPVWARAVVAARPYPDMEAVIAAARAALAALPWPEIARALDAHPRIGTRPAGDRQEAAWSRREQAGVDHDDDRTLAALAEVNRAYDERFGHVLLIFASGKSGAELLEIAQGRLRNDEATERRVIRDELGKIVALRVERLLDVHGAVTG